jgi:tetratricopeptide (TPR) repeat protein
MAAMVRISVPLALALLVSCQSAPSRAEPRSAVVERSVEADAERDPSIPAHLLLAPVAGVGAERDPALRASSIASFRTPLGAREAVEPSSVLRRELTRIAEALEQDDIQVALSLCELAARAHPAAVEPLELALLARMRTEDAEAVTATIERIGRIDPANPFFVALRGMRAAGVGDAAAALGSLAWFVGPEALPRRGALAPLFTAPGELEEQAAFAALRLGRPQAALEALDAAIDAAREARRRQGAGDGAAERRASAPRRVEALELLRADALALLGRNDEALDALTPLADELSRGRTEDPLPLLAAIRLDAIRAVDARVGGVDEGSVATGDDPASDALINAVADAATDAPLDRAVAGLLALPSDELRLWRVVSLAARAGREARTRATVAVDGARATFGPIRHALLLAALDPARRTQSLDDAWLELRDLGAPIDRAALRLTLRHLARHKRERLLPVAAVVAQWRPNELDAVAVALLASGVDADALLEGLIGIGANPAAAALRSRIESRFGFAARGYATASEGRVAFPASKVLRVAGAMSAVDLADATLLAEVDGAARDDDGSIDRTFALAWFALQEMPTARARAEDALRFDARDDAAALCASLASLEDPESRADAARRIRALAERTDWIGAEAWSMQGEVRAAEPHTGAPGSADAGAGDPRTAVGDAAWPAAASATAALRALAAWSESQRIPLAAECLALAEEIDPAQGAVRSLQRLSILPQAPPRFAAWSRAAIAEAPALPERRLLGVARAAVAREIPKAPLSARFDAIAAAPREVRARIEREALALRPATVVAKALECEMLAEQGEFDAALARVDEVIGTGASSPPPSSSPAPDPAPLPTMAGRRVLATLVRIAEREPARGPALAARVEPLVLRLRRLSPADLRAAGTVRMMDDPGPGATQRCMELLGDRARPMLDAECDACIEMLGALATKADDPFASAVLAERLCMQRRIAPEVRARLATAAVALRVGAGADADETVALVDRLLAAGAVPWSETVLRPARTPSGAHDEVAPSRGAALARAAELFGLLGSDGESRALLEAALAASPEDADIMNSVAYADIEAGAITGRTASLAERAGRARPDDPAVLDTIGWLRYQQGRFRDDASGAGAISILRQALRIRPNSPSIATLDHLGDALWRAGDQEGAVRSWQQVGVVARRRYPPELFGERMSLYQRRTFGFELVPIVRFVRREFAAVVERTQRKLEQVAAGTPPEVAECTAAR